MVTWKRVYPRPTEFFGVGRRPRHFEPGPELRAIKLLLADRHQKPGMKNLWHSQVFRPVESQGAHTKRVLVLVFLPLIVKSNHYICFI